MIICRPGYLGKRRDETFERWDKEYGKGNWSLIWLVGSAEVDFLGACALYEDAYFVFLNARQDVLNQLISEACDIYDDDPSNIRSCFDYTKQETHRTHIQDIAIRRCLIRFGVWFNGPKLIRIRQELGDHALSMILSPGKVPFHMPQLIVEPQLHPKWANPGSVESFYQSNRFLQARTQPSS
ncbi:MAG: hypothetical protein AAB646_01670 [Patescibacteria group bacterium]